MHANMRHASRCFGLPCLLVWLAVPGCSGKKHIVDRNDLGDQINVAISVASETVFLTKLIATGKTTPTFIEAHRTYLEKEVQEVQKQLQELQPAPGSEQVFHEFSQRVDELQTMVEKLPSHASSELAAVQARCAELKHSMQDLK
jgi:hypothetical protein